MSRSTLRLALWILLVAAVPAMPARADGAERPLTARAFSERSGKVLERAEGTLVLRGRSTAGTEISGALFDAVSIRVRFAGRRCRRARAVALVNGRTRVLRPRAGRWRSYRLASKPSRGRRTLRVRLRAPSRCRLVVAPGVLHLVVQQAFAAPAARAPRADTVALGAAVAWDRVSAMPGYAERFLEHFAVMTPENELKMNALQPKRGTFDFTTADRMVDWALAHGKAVRGHTLIFKHQLPGWLTNPTLVDRLTGAGEFDRQDILDILRSHITTVMRHYAGRVGEWDVVNEALRPDGSYNPGLWLDTLGPGYVEEAYRTARAADPRAKLCYNEIGAEVAGPLADAVYALVARLRAQGLLDCVGFQLHVNAATPPSLEALQQNLERFAQLGLDLHVTEMDVNVSELQGDPAAKRAVQARIFGDAALACQRVAACSRFTTWGFTDASTWLGPEAQPLPFDETLAPKPAWSAIQHGLSGG